MESTRRAHRLNVNLFMTDVTSDGDWRVPTFEGAPLGISRDWSAVGVFVETAARPAVATVLEVSFVWGDESVRSRARVIRHGADGIALEFVNPPGEFSDVVLDMLLDNQG